MPKIGSAAKNEQWIFTKARRRFLGFKPYSGDTDKLYKRLTEGLLNIPDGGWESPEQNPSFQYSNNLPYRIQVFRRGRPVEQEVPINATGGIFNLEFSPDGKILSAACEKKNILIFDPLSRRIVKNLENAHRDCVNCVRFLDTRTFASCSDDTTVALWDVRNLKTRIRTLRGHSKWVKNIEYSRKDNLLVTSGFDGAIYTWEFNNYSEGSANFKKVFNTSGLMRMRLTPDAEKMVISTMNGFLMVVHDLNLEHLPEDLKGFKPLIYRQLQTDGKFRDQAPAYTKLFHAKRNRVELISDFPEGNEAEIIASLRLHPQGWVAVTRNTSVDENSEWCCVHDIQSIDTREEDDVPVTSPEPRQPLASGQPPNLPSRISGQLRQSPFVRISMSLPSVPTSRRSPDSSPADEDDNRPSSREQEREEEDEDSVDDEEVVQRFRSGNIEIISTGTNDDPARSMRTGMRINIRMFDSEQDDDNENGEETAESVDVDGTNFLAAETLDALDVLGDGANDRGGAGPSSPRDQGREDLDPRVPPASRSPNSSPRGEGGGEPSGRGESLEDRWQRFEGFRNGMNDLDEGPSRPGAGMWIRRGGNRILFFGTRASRRAMQARVIKDAKVHHNSPRLLHYIEESNTGRGFIKEQCFSPCGRVIASPFGYGVRLLGWNASCADLSECVPASPVKLYEFGEKASHTEVVVSTAFNPCHWQLVTGCLGGKISWHSPVL